MQAVFSGDKASVTGERIKSKLVFECGQAFRFNPCNGGYFGVAKGRGLFVSDNPAGGIDLYPVTKGEYETLWYDYFDLSLPYGRVYSAFAEEDEILKEAAREFSGLRLLNQEPFETLVSFIISANNNEKRIKSIVENLCAAAGEKRECLGRTFYTFPTPEALFRLGPEELFRLGAGYRAPYLYETAKAVCEGFSLSDLSRMSYDEAKKELLKLKGVGPKVADCILLFAFNKKEAFPVDTWIKKVLKEVYAFAPKKETQLHAFLKERFGGYGGIAQQYLFHYARTHMRGL